MTPSPCVSFARLDLDEAHVVLLARTKNACAVCWPFAVALANHQGRLGDRKSGHTPLKSCSPDWRWRRVSGGALTTEVYGYGSTHNRRTDFTCPKPRSRRRSARPRSSTAPSASSIWSTRPAPCCGLSTSTTCEPPREDDAAAKVAVWDAVFLPWGGVHAITGLVARRTCGRDRGGSRRSRSFGRPG